MTRFQPTLESLEAREVPAVNFSLSGGVLRINGGISAEHIAINDQGNGTVRVYTSGNLHSFAGVAEVEVNMNRGNDHVDFILQGNQTTDIDYHINLGNGDDTFTHTVNNKVISGDLQMFIYGDVGNDEFYGDIRADVLNTSTYRLHCFGEGGEDFIQIFAPDVDVFGQFTLFADGGWNNDTIKIVTRGELDLLMSVRALGGEYDDIIDVEVTLDSGSSGQLFSSLVDGGSGGDDLSFFVRKQTPTDPAFVNATIQGGIGNDSAIISATFVQYGNDIENLLLV